MSSPAANTQTTSQDDGDSESTYHLKWIPWNSGKIPIVMQSINGPCPLIATMNVLLLREKVKLPTMLEQITATQLLAYIGECIMDSVPVSDVDNDENALLNLEQNIHDAMEILPKLKTGLDVNIRFTGITDFEYTPECIIFDLLRIPLYHGWLSDPSLFELQNAIGNQSYNQLVDNIITNKSSQDPLVSTRVLIAEEFLEKTASQLTLHGLCELKSKIKENEIGILFRNNHFLTLFKRDLEIYTLVTDHGYLTEDNIIWETLDNLEGAGRFFDANFQVAETTNRQVSELNAIDQRQQQLENDLLMALSLKEEYAQEGSGAGPGGGGETTDLDSGPNIRPEHEVTSTTTTTIQDAGPSSSATTTSTTHQGGATGEEDDFELAKRLQAEEDRMYQEMIRDRQQRQRSGSNNDDRPLAVIEYQQRQPPEQPFSTFQVESAQEAPPILVTQSEFPPLGPPIMPPPPSNQSETTITTTISTPPKSPTIASLSQQSSQDPNSQSMPNTSQVIQNTMVDSTSRSRMSPGEGQHHQVQQPTVNRNPDRRSRGEKNPKDSNCIIS